jgi:hypothetical protein
LRVTGELADDTLPINAGPRTIEGFIAPTITRAVDLAAIGPAETVTRRLKSYLDAAATDLALVPLQAERAELRRLYKVAAAF